MTPPDAQASEGAVGEVVNPPAFPNTGNGTWNMRPDSGMTLRDWFAGQAMPEVMRQMHAHPDGWTDDEAAQVSYDMADAMLRARLPAAAVAAVEGENGRG